MQLWPHSAVEIGFGPMFGGLGGWFEALVCLVGVTIYALWARRAENRRRRWGVVISTVLAMYLAAVAVAGQAAAAHTRAMAETSRP